LNYRDTKSDRSRADAIEDSFVPEHCPYPHCPTNADQTFRWIKWGWHGRQRAPFRVRRYQCLGCERTFSTQTFRGTYWQKRPDIDRLVQDSGRSCSGNRQIATMIGCSHTTVANKVERLARQGLRFHLQTLAKAPKLTGGLCFDGFASFEYAQYFPYWMNLGVHKETSFVLGFTESPQRRRGTMTPRQKRRRAELEDEYGTPDGDAVEVGTRELLESVRPFFDLTKTTLVSDLCPFYPAAVRDAGFEGVPWTQVPGRAARTTDNPLFEINLADLLIRHGNSSQKRETIAFNKRRQAGLERAWLWATWRNYMRPRNVKEKDDPPAVQAGLQPRALGFEDIFGTRIFGWRQNTPAAWDRQLRRDVETAVFPCYRRNARKLAY
jgi:transposase-like protein